MNKIKLFSAALLATAMWTGAAAAQIVIGAYGPVTGPAASVGELALPGLKLAIADINTSGGIHGEDIVLKIMDDQCDPKQAVAAVNKLAAEGAKLVVGFSCSGPVKAASDVLEQEGIPHLATLASNPDLTRRGLKTLFRPAVRDDSDAKAALAFITKHYADKKIALVHDNSVWGKGMADLVDNGLRSISSKKIATKVYQLNAKEQDYSALISRMKQDGVGLLYVALYMREGGLLVRQAVEQGYKGVIVGSVLFNMPDFISIVGNVANGAFYSTPQLNLKKFSDLNDRLNLGKGNNINIYTYQSYAAGQIIEQALNAHGTIAEDILKSLREDSFDTVLGKIKFDDHGDINDPTFDIMKYQNGKGIKF